MANKSFAVMNMAYRDVTRESDYLLERVQGKPTFNIPVNMKETQYMYASVPTEMICQDTLRELENDQYTQQEIDLKIQDLQLDIERHINDMIAIGTQDEIDVKHKPVNEERLILNVLPLL